MRRARWRCVSQCEHPVQDRLDQDEAGDHLNYIQCMVSDNEKEHGKDDHHECKCTSYCALKRVYLPVRLSGRSSGRQKKKLCFIYTAVIARTNVQGLSFEIKQESRLSVKTTDRRIEIEVDEFVEEEKKRSYPKSILMKVT